MTLVRICKTQWHAVERDLLALNWAWDRVERRFSHLMTGTILSDSQLISILIASPPGSAVYHAETRGDSALTPEAQMLARISEQQAGVVTLTDRYTQSGETPAPQRQKVDSFAALPDYGGFKLDSMTVDELNSKRAELMEQAQARETEGLNSDRVVRDEYNPNKRGNSVLVGSVS